LPHGAFTGEQVRTQTFWLQVGTATQAWPFPPFPQSVAVLQVLRLWKFLDTRSSNTLLRSVRYGIDEVLSDERFDVTLMEEEDAETDAAGPTKSVWFVPVVANPVEPAIQREGSFQIASAAEFHSAE